MFPPDPYAVAFYGGPFDGHIESCSIKPDLLPEHLVCYVSVDTLRRIYGITGSDRNTVTSVVIYAKRRHRDRWTYFFTKAIAPENVSINPV